MQIESSYESAQVLPKGERGLSVEQRDKVELARHGKRSQLKVGFLGSHFFVNATALAEAGPVGLLYDFVYCFLGTLATAASLAELVSLAPTSGGQYHWVAMLSPPSCRKFLSWFTGWMCVLGWQAFVASGAFLCATITQGLVTLNNSVYTPERWQGALILYAVLLVSVFINTYAAEVLPQIESIILVIHILGFFGILIPLTYLAPIHNADFVFTTFASSSGWSSKGTAWLIGLQSGVFPFLGYDGACHMAEEVKNAARIVPRCMITAVIINGFLAFGIVVAFLFTMGDIEDILATATGYDFIQVFFNVTDSHAGTSIMVSVLICLALFATFGLLALTSRMTWAFARDNGLPFSHSLATVHQPTFLPLRSIALSTTVSALLALINVGSTAAFNAIVSIAIAGLSLSYFVPISLFICRRWANREVKLGPWRMGRVGIFVNEFALLFLFITTTFSFFPPNLPVNGTNMNYSCVVFGGSLISGIVYYITIKRHHYVSPVVEGDRN